MGELTRLAEPFTDEEIEWRVQTTIKEGTSDQKSLYLPYVTNRAIQNRLDEVFGVGGWSNEYKQAGDGWLCGITARFKDEKGEIYTLTKWDGASSTHIEPLKGGLSDAMKRAAVQWGIGRYLYDLEPVWCKTTGDKKYPKNSEPNKLRVGVQGSTTKRQEKETVSEMEADTDEIVKSILNATSIEELRALFTNAIKQHKNDTKAIERITAAKDRKKAELEVA